MGLDLRKKRRDGMMLSKSFETQEVTGTGRRVERLFRLLDGNSRKCLPDEWKGMQRPGKIENVQEKIHARARKVL